MDDVSKFLQDVKEMNARRTEEDDARQRELDEKIQQEKRERQARRAERARSISPQKSSPANTPPPSSHRSTARLSESLRLSSGLDNQGSPRDRSRASLSFDSPDRDAYGTTDPIRRDSSHAQYSETDEKPANTAVASMASPTSPQNNNNPQGPRTLSWQRRPPSRGSEKSKSRPLSMVAAQNNAARTSTSTPPEPSPEAGEQSFSKDQIANALGSKDPSWFRQTADRGVGSAAYRKNQVEDSDTLDMSSVKTALPGMDRPSATETRELPRPPREDSSPERRVSPLSMPTAPRLDPPTEDELTGRPGSALNSGRSSPTRPISPTKGMGGFVQSAMMKRSDSVKRWSVTSPPGLARADSVASNRNSMHSRSRSRPTSMFRERSDVSTDHSRPTSSHSNSNKDMLTGSDATTKAKEPAAELPPIDTSVKDDDDKTTPPASPSKTMDPRRWSPTKASWLETALNKPESPKPKPAAAASNQPAWMVELNKAKAQKTGGDSGRSGSISSRHEVNIGGLMRSSPMGAAAKPLPTGLGGIYSPPTPGQRSFRGNLRPTSIDKPDIKPKPELSPNLDSDVFSDESTAIKRSSTTSLGSAAGSKPPKPETPPKKDFRANLKPRQPPPGGGSQGQGTEFQNVFGNLRRTKTQNYVAPDELKGNILRGKAALNVTDGPKPSERRDEFKDAILKKKEDFKKAQEEGKGITRNVTSPIDKSIPEGLARAQELAKSTTGRKNSAAGHSTESVTSPVEQRPLSFTQREEPVAPLRVQSPPIEPKSPALQKETSAPARLQTKSSGGLADRFNPALAGLLARGPPPMAANGGKTSEEGASKPTATAPVSEPSAPGPQLTHMTKGRARGPKRKAPSSSQSTASTKSVSTPAPKPAVAAVVAPLKENIPPKAAETPKSPPPKPLSPKMVFKPAETPAKDIPKPVQSPRSPPLPTSPSTSLPKSIQEQVTARASARPLPSPPKPAEVASPRQPEPPVKSPPASRPISTSAPFASLRRTPSPTKSAFGDRPEEAPVSQPSSPKKLDMKRMSRFFDEPKTEVKPEPKVEVKPEPRIERKPEPRFEAKPEPKIEPKYEPKPIPKPEPKKELRIDPKPLAVVETPMKSGFESVPPTPGSPSKQASEVSSLLNGFFGTSRPKRDYNVDSAEILMNRPPGAPRVHTTGFGLFQLFGDGKKVPVPAHNERVLFEQDMYICAHHFNNEAGKKATEVYFWAGDQVAESAIEDAQLFASREARAIGGPLIKIRQGKETPAFLQAMGGVVITRRGSGNKYDSLAANMLCGRRHLGQVVFDEVDFSPASLCSGFPFLITQQGGCYLWKGRGSNVDELGCARLIGMDLTLTGELHEIEDGAEPANFWALFGGGASGSKPHSADHWRLKPNYDKYCGRLFCSDASGRQQITEVSPFSQADLSPSGIYVLDAFFEMYIVVGRDAQPHYASFRNALDFAQEYAILASGMEDRPFVPVSTVVLEGIPRDLKRVFRTWRDERSPTAAPQQLKRGRSLRVVPLTQALQAMSEY